MYLLAISKEISVFNQNNLETRVTQLTRRVATALRHDSDLGTQKRLFQIKNDVLNLLRMSHFGWEMLKLHEGLLGINDSITYQSILLDMSRMRQLKRKRFTVM